jgi:hypothetical protein
VELLGNKGELEFTQDASDLQVKFPAEKPCDYCYALKITGLKLPPAAASIPSHPVTSTPDAPAVIPQ